MVSPISKRARKYVRDQATVIMEATCRIERVSGPSLDPSTNRATAGARVTLYTGKCRLWEVSGGSEVVVGDSDISVQNTNLSIPWNAAFPEGVPMKGDEFIMLSHHTDSHVVGKRGHILDVAKAGDLRATRRYAVKMTQPQTQGDDGGEDGASDD